MEILRPIGLLIVSIIITGAIVVAMLIDVLAVPANAAPPAQCPDEVHPVLQTLEFIDAQCRL